MEKWTKDMFLDTLSYPEGQLVVAKCPDSFAMTMDAVMEDEDWTQKVEQAFCEVMEELSCQYLMLTAMVQEELRLLFISRSKEVRALEFLNYLIPEFGLVKGNERSACGRISHTILKVQMSAIDIKDYLQYMYQKSVAYFTTIAVIEPLTYAKEHESEIVSLNRYRKQKIAWAYVQTLDVAEEGSKLRVRSLENESGIQVIAGKNAYIMIGCRGEVYDMKESKFLATYEPSEEPLDVFEQMLEFIPEIETIPEGEFVTLDEVAHLCYPKQGSGIYARRLEEVTKVFPTYANGDYFIGRPGDYLAVREDDITDIYIIQGDIFRETYEKIEE